ncbi:MAG: 6-phosphogluconolactonase [Deltaproteobacteria bacterium]|nr:MAG: 6-phosphogluconolactonase [Deltaproteobacteria bacterium]
MLQTFSNLEALSQAAAALFARLAAVAVKSRGRFSVALSGGSTPRRTYEILAQPPFREEVPWNRIHVFWGDERCVPPSDPRSNTLMARKAWLDQVPVPQTQIHPISCQLDPGAGAREYESLLRDFFGSSPPCLDLVLLGLGKDGHTASLFPDNPALRERERWTATVQVPGEDIHRVTLTPVLINRAAAVAFLAAGAAKAGALREVLQGPRGPLRLPAQVINPDQGELYWLVDREAAKEITIRHRDTEAKRPRE